MQIGFGLPVSGTWATPGNQRELARRAEELGYASLWTFQRLLVDANEQAPPVYLSVQDALLPLAYVAAVTAHVRLGVAIVNVPFVSPVLLAKQLTTLDVLSEGRLDAGLGSGWQDVEFVASGVDRAHRGARMEEYLTVLDKVWADDLVEHHGRFYEIPASRFEPRPVQQPHPPLLLGGSAPAALSRAGRRADGWISASREDLAGIGDAVRVVRQAAEEAGRDPQRVRIVSRGVVRLHGQRHQPLSGDADAIRADLGALADAGVDEVFLDLNFDPRVGSPNADPTQAVEHAHEVLETFSPAA